MKEEKEPEFDNWRDAWNYHAVKQSKDYNSLSEKKLLKLIENKEWDTFYTIWDAIKKKGTIKRSSWILFNVLVEETEEWADLTRHHCAEALFTILGIEDMKDLLTHWEDEEDE